MRWITTVGDVEAAPPPGDDCPCQNAQHACPSCCEAHQWGVSPEGWKDSPAGLSPMRTSECEWSTPDAKQRVRAPRTPSSASTPTTRERTRRWSVLSPHTAMAVRAPTVVDATCALLERMTQACNGPSRGGRVAAPIFHSVSIPAIGITDYLITYLIGNGLAKKESGLVDATVLHALCLVDRLLMVQAASGFHLCESNVHRVLLVVMLLSSKVLDDDVYSNRYWATVGGVTLDHLNLLEIHMSQLLSFRVLVSVDTLDNVREKLLQL